MGTVAGRAQRRNTGAQGGALKRGADGAAGRTPVPGRGSRTVRRRQQSAIRFSTTRTDYAGSGCGAELVRANTWSHDWNRNSRKAARTAPQKSRREPNPARTRWYRPSTSSEIWCRKNASRLSKKNASHRCCWSHGS